MRRSLFITLDNTLITTKSKQKYALHSEDWKFNNQAVACINDFAAKHYMIIIVSNQARIAQGFFNDKTFLYKMDLIVKTLEKDLLIKKNIITYEYCIDEDSFNYLPKPGMIYQLALEFNLDLKNSYLLGNSLIDKEITNYCGISNYIELTNLNYFV